MSAALAIFSALILPFRRLDRALLAGTTTLALSTVAGQIMWRAGSQPVELFFGNWFAPSDFYIAFRYPRDDALSHPLYSGLWLVSYLAFAWWFCAWQRAVCRDFDERIGVWLVRSLAALPLYAAVLFLWFAGRDYIAETIVAALVSDRDMEVQSFDWFTSLGVPLVLFPLEALFACLLFPTTAAIAAGNASVGLLALRAQLKSHGARLFFGFLVLLLISWGLATSEQHLAEILPGWSVLEYGGGMVFGDLISVLWLFWLSGFGALSVRRVDAVRERELLAFE